MRTNPEIIARVAHDALSSFSASVSEFKYRPWHTTPEDGRDATIEHVKTILDNPDMTVEEIHEEWLRVKIEDGWELGPERDYKRKVHPNLVSFDQLSVYDVDKDRLFLAIVRCMGGWE